MDTGKSFKIKNKTANQSRLFYLLLSIQTLNLTPPPHPPMHLSPFDQPRFVLYQIPKINIPTIIPASTLPLNPTTKPTTANKNSRIDSFESDDLNSFRKFFIPIVSRRDRGLPAVQYSHCCNLDFLPWNYNLYFVTADTIGIHVNFNSTHSLQILK